MAVAQADQQARIKSLEAKGVRYGLASYVDIHGRPKCKAVPISHFAQMLRGSELFTGAALDGVPQEVNDNEVAAHPDIDRAITSDTDRVKRGDAFEKRHSRPAHLAAPLPQSAVHTSAAR